MDTSGVSAAELVRHRIEQRGMSVSAALARAIGVPQSNLSEMLAGKRDWSKTAIRGLSRHLNIRRRALPGMTGLRPDPGDNLTSPTVRGARSRLCRAAVPALHS